MSILFYVISLLLLFGILALFAAKSAYQLQYLRKKRGQKAGPLSDFWRFKWSDARARQERWEAFLLFPMLYVLVPDEGQGELNDIKIRVKRIHVWIYLLLIVLIVLGVLSERLLA